MQAAGIEPLPEVPAAAPTGDAAGAVVPPIEPEAPVEAPMPEPETPAAGPMETPAAAPVPEMETVAAAPMTEAAAPEMAAADAPVLEPAAPTMAMPETQSALPEGAAISSGDVPAVEAPAMAPMIEAAAPGPAESSGPKEANLIFTVAAKRATLTKTGLLLEGVSPVVSYVSDVPKKNAGRFNTTFFTSDAFAENGTWLLNPDAVLMGVVSAGGAEGTNNTVGTVVLKLSNPVYNASRYTLRLDSEIQTPDQNALTLAGGNANFQIDEAGDKLLEITDRTVLMDNLLFIDAWADVGKAADGGAKFGLLGQGYCNPLGSLTSFGCEGVYGSNGVYYSGRTLGR